MADMPGMPYARLAPAMPRIAVILQNALLRATTDFGRGISITLILLCALAPSSKLAAQESPHGKLRFSCDNCHTPDGWKMRTDAGFKHEVTGFTLTGQHKSVACETCHQGLKFKKQASDCLACHADIHKSELGTHCLRCHTTQSWRIADMVQKHQSTRFPLLGRHATIDCQVCHVNVGRKQFAGTPTDCYGCHLQDFARTTSPNHSAGGFSTDCIQCHQITSMRWGTGFGHQLTAFPLTGAHLAVACTDCHKNQMFKSTPTECVACHQKNYSATQNPNHTAARFPTTCLTCHTTTSWEGAAFDHAQTNFALTGAHIIAQCTQCHVNGNYGLTYQNCYQCHAVDYAHPSNPNHAAQLFPVNCEVCHSTSAWTPSTLNHDAAYFRIYSGKHRNRWSQCSQCHATPGSFTSYRCSTACHQTAHNQGKDCYGCHRNA